MTTPFFRHALRRDSQSRHAGLLPPRLRPDRASLCGMPADQFRGLVAETILQPLQSLFRDTAQSVVGSQDSGTVEQEAFESRTIDEAAHTLVPPQCPRLRVEQPVEGLAPT